MSPTADPSQVRMSERDRQIEREKDTERKIDREIGSQPEINKGRDSQ